MTCLGLHWRRGILVSSSSLVLAIVGIAGCLEAPHAGDRRAPRLVSITPRFDRAMSPTPILKLTFDEAIDPVSATAERVVIVPFDVGEACSVDMGCDRGMCVLGRCQVDPVDEAFVADMAHLPLSERHRKRRVPVVVTLGETRHVVRVTPTQILVPRTLHALLVAPGLADHRGNAVSGPPLRRDFFTGARDLGRPHLEMLSPRAGETDVPANVARVLVRASVPLLRATGEGLFWLEDGEGERVALRSVPADDVCSGPNDRGRCLWLRLARPLVPLRVWHLRAAREVKGADGQSLFSDGRLRFASASGPDERTPAMLRWRLRVSDRCLLVDAQGSEATDLRLKISGGGPSHVDIGKVLHHVGVPISVPLVTSVRFKLEDLAGNVAPPVRVNVRREVTSRVVITEILANPRGLEPAQEWVELLNLSEKAVDVGGWTLDDNDDGVGRNVLPSALLGPGQYAVIVGSRFDAMSPVDPPIAKGAVLLRVDGSVGSLGLANGGESLALRDASGRLVSSYGGFLSMARTQDEGRSVVRRDPFACDLPEAWERSRGEPTPGAPDRHTQ